MKTYIFVHVHRSSIPEHLRFLDADGKPCGYENKVVFTKEKDADKFYMNTPLGSSYDMCYDKAPR